MSPRLLILSLLLAVAGVFLTLRFLVHYVRALSRRFRRGVPYMYGSAGRAFLLLMVSTLILFSGAILGAVGWGLTAYQPFAEAVRVGSLQVTIEADRSLTIIMQPASGYPVVGPSTVNGVPGGNWSLVGRFILWHRSMKWLGLKDAHRVALILTVPNAENIPRQESMRRKPLLPGGGDRLWNLLRTYDRYLPLVETREFQSPWKIGPAADLQLYASRVGYLLAEGSDSE